MTARANRKDNWSPEDDKLLAETVIRHIRGGSTQLKAFEEAAASLSRSSAACGFRWNSAVRKQHQKDIEEAKKTRLKLETRTGVKVKISEATELPAPSVTTIPEEPLDKQLELFMEIAKRFKKTIDNMGNEIRHLREELVERDREIERLNSVIKNEEPAELVAEDYQTFLKILHNARKLNAL
jgi:prespore-specific regulator